jgi:DNA-damage-inducible protein D
MNNAIVLFEGKKIRSVEHEGQIQFVITDILEALTDTTNPKQYWQKLNRRDAELKGSVQIVRLLFETEGGKQRMNCTNTEGVLRLIQSVPSPNAEPFKMWLAGLGKQAIEETFNPELLSERQAELYRAKGYPEEWIKERLQTIATRRELTDEWQKRGIKEGQEYGILTATIAKGTFGLTPSEHSQLKGLEKENLRDHMTRMELILTSLSEEVTRAITVKQDAQGFHENHEAATKGGEVGQVARLNVEKATGEQVVSAANFLNQVKSETNLSELPENTPPQ